MPRSAAYLLTDPSLHMPTSWRLRETRSPSAMTGSKVRRSFGSVYADDLVCCCPPNMSRTLGILGGYVWRASVQHDTKIIDLDVYLFASAARTIQLPDGSVARVTMKSGMPWNGGASWIFDAPTGWGWRVKVPKPTYAGDAQVSRFCKGPDHC